MTIHDRATEYILLNKDAEIMTFSCTRTEFDEPVFTENKWFSELRPIGYRGLEIFLERRKAPKHRKHIEALLERYGCADLEGFLQVTHALSLNDTFWIKRVESDLAWNDISLYRNEFNELISEAAFDGTISETDLSSTSPEFGTDGHYAKCWMREDDEIYLYKSGSSLHEIEPLSEYLASQLAAIVCPDAVSYDLAFHHGRLVSKCALFTTEQVGLAKAAAVFGGEQTMPALLDYFAAIGSGDSFRRMCVLDALIYNPDRHYGNFGVLFDTDTMRPLGMAPVFDHNLSLFPQLDEEQLRHPDWYLQKCRPRLGRDFVRNAKGLLTPEIRTELKELRDFRFQQHPIISASQERLDLLSSLVNRQVKRILDET